MIFKTQVGVQWESKTHYPEVFDMSSGKDKRISITKHKTSLILNSNLTGFSGWPTHEIQETNCRKANSDWVKLPLDKSMKDDET